MSRAAAVLGAGLALVAGTDRGAAQLTSWAVDPGVSYLYVVTHKAGLLGFLGHEHAIVPGDWRARLCLADPIPPGAQGSLLIRTTSLVIDSDSARALAGLGDGPGEEDRREIRRKMLSVDYLDAEGFPEIRLDLRTTSAAAGDRVEAEGTLSLHGVTREVGLTLAVDRQEEGALVLEGTLRIRMRDFGIEPESIARVVNVANEVDMYVRLVAGPEGRTCPAAAAPRSEPGPVGRIEPAPGGALRPSAGEALL